MSKTEGLNETWQARIDRALEVLDWSRPRLAMVLKCSERTIDRWRIGACEPHWSDEARELLDDLETRHNIRERYTERQQTHGNRQSGIAGTH